MSVRMSNEMRELRGKLCTVLDELDGAVRNGNMEEATARKAEAEKLRGLYDMAERSFLERRQMETEEPHPQDANEAKYNAELFYKAIGGGVLTEAESRAVGEAKAVYANKFSEGSSKDGGMTVPDDLSREIFSAVAEEESVRNLVYVENVTSATGTRIFRGGQPVKLYNTAEYDEMKELANRNYEPVRYSQKKFAGMMEVSNELLEDSFVNFKQEFVEWMSEAARNTENAQIFYGAGGEKHCQGLLSTANAYRELDAASGLSVDFLRAAYLKVKQGYRTNGRWIMNSDGFAQLCALKYEDGRSVIQPNPKEADSYVLFGFPIAIYDTIRTDEEKTVIAFGDFRRAYRMFPRREFGVAFTDVGAGAFESDSVKARGTERFDGKVMDREAIVILRNVSVTAPALTETASVLSGEMTEATLKNLTKSQLTELAEDLGIALESGKTKDEMVTAILAASAE